MKVNYYLQLIIIAFFLFSCNAEKESIITVAGTIQPTDMGLTLVHEHILVDFIGAKQTGYHRWDRNEVVSKVLPFLLQAREKGVQTILECTPAYLGRDPLLLQMLAEKSGLNILTNSGFYGAVEDKYIPDFAFDISADSLAAIWIDEFRNGIEDTGIRPGFIKISVDNSDVLSVIDAKIVRAAIITHRQTGLTITSHTVKDGPAFAQLALLNKMEVDPRAWVWTHASGGTAEGRIKAARQGAWISIDDVNKDELPGTLEKIDQLKDAGLLDHVLISHDAGWYKPDEPGGGNFKGYTDITNYLVPALQEKGYTAQEIDQLLIVNPRDAYAIQVR